mmetsp:Transcript_7614/g.17941  ORF Transcript_7614/g.17941 Transcript_7614/m.17941 type:complete len:229 (+) Transcript_7614:649-1335(+)
MSATSRFRTSASSHRSSCTWRWWSQARTAWRRSTTAWTSASPRGGARSSPSAGCCRSTTAASRSASTRSTRTAPGTRATRPTPSTAKCRRATRAPSPSGFSRNSALQATPNRRGQIGCASTGCAESRAKCSSSLTPDQKCSTCWTPTAAAHSTARNWRSAFSASGFGCSLPRCRRSWMHWTRTGEAPSTSKSSNRSGTRRRWTATTNCRRMRRSRSKNAKRTSSRACP